MKTDPNISPTLDIPHDGGARFELGGVGFRWKIDGLQTQERFAVVHNLIAPRTLVAPLHLHHREDEYTYVLAGTLGVSRGNEILSADQGTWVFKPRSQWHTLWNSRRFRASTGAAFVSITGVIVAVGVLPCDPKPCRDAVRKTQSVLFRPAVSCLFH